MPGHYEVSKLMQKTCFGCYCEIAVWLDSSFADNIL